MEMGDRTSEEAFKQVNTTDDELGGEEEILPIEAIISRKNVDNVEVLPTDRPLTRRGEDKKWSQDKFRTEPSVVPTIYPIEMSNIDILQAKLNAIHDSESESGHDETFSEIPPKASPVSGDRSEPYQNPSSTINTCNEEKTSNLNIPINQNNTALVDKIKVPENIENPLRQNIPEKDSGYVEDNSSDVSFKNIASKCDLRKELTFRSKFITKIPPFKGDTKNSEKKPSNTCDFATSTKLYTEKNCECNTMFKDSKNAVSSTDRFDRKRDIVSKAHIRKDIGLNTDFSLEIKDSGVNTDVGPSREDSASNTEHFKELKDIGLLTELSNRTNAASNTEYKNQDVASVAKPHQKDFTCKTNISKQTKDVIVNTNSFKTVDVSCFTDIQGVSAGTQKNKLEGVQMTVNNIENIDIPSGSYLKKSEVLQFQLLPSINIVSEPTFQKVLQFYIDQSGRSHVNFRSSVKRIGYIEVQSPSMTTQRAGYDHGFREIQKVDPSKIVRKSKRNCRFLDDKKYNQYYESASEAENMLEKTMNVSRKIHSYELTTSTGDDKGTVIEEENSENVRIKDETLVYLTQNETYLRKNCSDSSLVVRIIKEVSTRALRSDSDTTSRVNSIWSNRICSNKNFHSSADSSQWVGEFVNQNMDEKVYKTFINPEGLPAKHNYWKYSAEKTQTNLEHFMKMKSTGDTTEPELTYNKPIQTRNSSRTKTLPEKESAKKYAKPKKIVTLNTTSQPPLNIIKPISISSSTQNLSTYTSSLLTNNVQSSNEAQWLKNTDSIEDGIQILNKNQKKKIKTPTDTSTNNLIKAIKTPEKSCSKTYKTSTEKAIQTNMPQLVQVPIPTSPSKTSKEKCSQSGNIPKPHGTSWEQISLTVTYTTDEDSSTRHNNANLKNKENFKELTNTVRRKQKIQEHVLTNQSSKKSSSIEEQHRNKEIKRKHKNKNRTEVIKKNNIMTACGDSKIEQDPKVNQKHQNDLLTEDICSKFRNLHVLETDLTTDTAPDDSCSEGEMRYVGSSIGEIRECNVGEQYNNFKRSLSFQKDIGVVPVRKRRNYFNNWITYYFNKNYLLPNSSSTSHE